MVGAEARAVVVRVFAAGAGGGNPAPIVVDAAGMTDAEMQAVGRAHGHESGFVLPAPAGSGCDHEFRFWVPNHEMSMCGHATVGAVWLLARLGRLRRDDLAILTRSGVVRARVARGDGEIRVEVSQPAGVVEDVPEATEAILDVLRLGRDALAPFPVQNARTSRVKTLVPLRGVDVLDGLRPDFARVETLCGAIGSTGLYPYAVSDRAGQVVDARQFPQASGYPEDAATGIAAAALGFGLLRNGVVAADRPVTVRQGRAMGHPSEIGVRFDAATGGCWLGGAVIPED